ncbi:MAG: NAD-dependent epimerase/dehydratase family protein [Acidimicrobiia bacterium]
MSRVLIAGASGLIGTALRQHPQIRAVTVSTVSRGVLPEPGHWTVDLTDSDEAQRVVRASRPDVIFLLAGGTGGDRLDLYSRNILPTVNIMSAVGDMEPVPYCLVLGSASEYGEGTGTPIGEDTPLQPLSPYGRAKLAQTTLAQSLAARFGIPLTVVRPFNAVSPHLTPATALGNMKTQLVEQTGSRRSVTCGRLDVVRDYIHLGFLVEVLVALMTHPLPGTVINACSGTGIRLEDVLQAMGRLLEVEVEVSIDEALAGIPAADVVVGDPRHLETSLGLTHRPTAHGIAALMLGMSDTVSSG